jgi:hypothetical protein
MHASCHPNPVESPVYLRLRPPHELRRTRQIAPGYQNVMVTPGSPTYAYQKTNFALPLQKSPHLSNIFLRSRGNNTSFPMFTTTMSPERGSVQHHDGERVALV